MSGTLFEMEDPQQLQQQLASDAEQQLAMCLSSLELGETTSLGVVASSTTTSTITTQSNCDGSDSGLDVPSSCCQSRITLQRGLSSTSGGYTSSNGLEEIYDSCELHLTSNVSPSEQSSECSQRTPPRRFNGSVKKKVAMFEPEPEQLQSGTAKTQEQLRGRVANLKRAASLPRNGAPTTPAREKPRLANSSSFRAPASTVTPVRTPRPQKPDTLPSALNRAQSVQRLAQVQRTPSLSRARTPGTPSEDGRWPANRGSAGQRRGMSVTPDVMASRMRGSPAPGELRKHSAILSRFSDYSTLNCRRHSAPPSQAAVRGGSECWTFITQQFHQSSSCCGCPHDLVGHGDAHEPAQPGAAHSHRKGQFAASSTAAAAGNAQDTHLP